MAFYIFLVRCYRYTDNLAEIPRVDEKITLVPNIRNIKTRQSIKRKLNNFQDKTYKTQIAAYKYKP